MVLPTSDSNQLFPFPYEVVLFIAQIRAVRIACSEACSHHVIIPADKSCEHNSVSLSEILKTTRPVYRTGKFCSERHVSGFSHFLKCLGVTAALEIVPAVCRVRRLLPCCRLTMCLPAAPETLIRRWCSFAGADTLAKLGVAATQENAKAMIRCGARALARRRRLTTRQIW